MPRRPHSRPLTWSEMMELLRQVNRHVMVAMATPRMPAPAKRELLAAAQIMMDMIARDGKA